MGIILYFYKQPHFFQLFYNSSPRLIAVHPLEFPAICINRGIIVHYIDFRQLMPFSNLKVVGVMGRGNFYYTGTKFHIHIGIRYNRDLPVNKGKQYFSSDKVPIPLIFRIYCNSRIPQHRFRTGRCKLQKLRVAWLPVFTQQRVFYMPEMACLRFIFHFRIGN